MSNYTLEYCPICKSNTYELYLQTSDFMITQESFSIQKCNACGFRFTNPRPTEDTIGSYYKSEVYISHSSTKKGFVNSLYNVVRNYTLKRKVKLVQFYLKTGKLVDVGSGSGHFVNACQKSGIDSHGYEPDDQARSSAISSFGTHFSSTKDLELLLDQSISVFSMWHVMEHLFHLQDDLFLLKRKLTKDGYLIIAVPNFESFDGQHYGKYWAAYDVPRHLYHFRKLDIVNLSVMLDMDLISVRPMKFDSYYVSLLSEKYKGGSLLKAFWIGFLSNLKSSKGGYSSQIYILKNKTN